MSNNKFTNFFKGVGSWIKSLFCIHNGKEPKLVTLSKKDGTKSVFSSLICIFAGVLIGFIFMLIMSFFDDQINVGDSFFGLIIMLSGPFSSGASQFVSFNFGNMIFYSAPLIMTGLSVAIAFKTGLFNIGAPGQFLMGTMGSLLIALNINCTGNPFLGFLVWLLAVIVGMFMGALWGCIPGLFKALFNVNEVIVCIMTNWIAANIVSWTFSSPALSHLVNAESGKSAYLITTKLTGTGTPSLGLGKLFNNSYIDIGIFVAIILAIVVYIILNKTTFGFELKACGYNKHASKYAGMNEKRNIVLSMAIAGGLAAIGGALYYLNPGIELNYLASYQKLPDYGFNGIPVALLASNNPLGVIFTGVFLRYISQGGENLARAGFNRYVADIVVALIIYFSGFSKLIRDIIDQRQKKKAQLALEKLASNQVPTTKTEDTLDQPTQSIQTQQTKEDN